MAERRMFAKTIIDSDAFLEMSPTAQVLYFHLSMRADDDGFINSPKRIMRMIGGGEDDMRLLIAKNFVILLKAAWWLSNIGGCTTTSATTGTRKRLIRRKKAGWRSRKTALIP